MPVGFVSSSLHLINDVLNKPCLETPFSAEGQEMGALLKRKGSDDDIQAVMDRIQALASEQGVDPVVANADVFMTTICWVGSKSLSHVLACIDRTKGRLVEVGAASPAARAQIITAVMTYWAAHPGVALSILEKLLNYSIISPISIVDWALVAASPCGGADGGHSLAKPHVLELVRNTVAKVSGRVREVLTSADAETREKEMQSMRDLLGAINAALAVWAAEDRDADVMDDGEGGAMIRRWASRWMRVFGRVAAIEEAFMVEAGKGNDTVTDGDDEIL